MSAVPDDHDMMAPDGADVGTRAQDEMKATLGRHRDAARQADGVATGADDAIGYIESVACGEQGFVWAVGWMNDYGGDPDRPVLIDDGGLHPGGFVCAYAARGDLPPGGKAFVALIRTDWRPSSGSPPRFRFMDGSGKFVQPPENFRVSSFAELFPVISTFLDRANQGAKEMLAAILEGDRNWSGEANDPQDHVYIDDAALLRGFGLFVSGWIVSATKELDYVAVRMGGEVVIAEPGTIMRQPRRDLAELYPSLKLATARAGFTATFEGVFDSRDLADARLRVGWSDGSAAHALIAPDRARILGVTAPIEDATMFYPALEAEGFFPAFARHAVAQHRIAARRLSPYACVPARRAVVMAVPTEPSDAILMFEGVLRAVDVLPDDWGLVFVAPADTLRSLVVQRFHDVALGGRHPTSLLFTGAARATHDVVMPACETLEIERVAFVADHVSLRPAGWRAIAEAAAPFALLAIDDLADHRTDADLSAFVADTARWQEIDAGARPLIGHGAGDPPSDAVTIAGAAMSLGEQTLVPFVRRLNAAAVAA